MSILYTSIHSAKIYCIYRWVWGTSMLPVRAAWSEGFWTKAGDRCTNTSVMSPSPSDIFALSPQIKSAATRDKWSSRRISCTMNNKMYLKEWKVQSNGECFLLDAPDSRLGLLPLYLWHMWCSHSSGGCLREHMSNTWEQTANKGLAFFPNSPVQDKRRANCKAERPKELEILGNKQNIR